MSGLAELRDIDEKHSPDSVEKMSVDSTGKPIDDVEMVKEVEALEDRLEHDLATDDEYRVEEAWEVALKVSLAAILANNSTRARGIGLVDEG